MAYGLLITGPFTHTAANALRCQPAGQSRSYPDHIQGIAVRLPAPLVRFPTFPEGLGSYLIVHTRKFGYCFITTLLVFRKRLTVSKGVFFI